MLMGCDFPIHLPTHPTAIVALFLYCVKTITSGAKTWEMRVWKRHQLGRHYVIYKGSGGKCFGWVDIVGMREVTPKEFKQHHDKHHLRAIRDVPSYHHKMAYVVAWILAAPVKLQAYIDKNGICVFKGDVCLYSAVLKGT